MDLNYIRPTRVEINLDNLKHNMKEIRRITSSQASICAVVKANGYGHGALEIATGALSSGASCLAVAAIEEAVELRQEGIKVPILVLGYTPDEQIEEVVKYDITQTIYSLASAQLLAHYARNYGRIAKVHIKLDTGMSRLGFQTDSSSIPEIIKIFQVKDLYIEGIFTHFAKADEKDKQFTEEQFRSFLIMTGKLERLGYKIPIKHTANSAAIMEFPHTHLDMVRPGIIMYGLYPSKEIDITKTQLKPVMSFKSRIAYVKTIGPGRAISYGGNYITQRKSIIATLPVGYADGYSRALSSRAHVLIKGHRAPLIGNMCMDQCMVDVTDIPGVDIGDDVTLFGEMENQNITADEIADIVGTINYEVVCSVSKRVPRVYIEGDKIMGIKNYIL
ncbi:MAG: alanine racemase [Thermoanaerobacterales bacterium]|nr:alanine racemase [Thermoanaerobacterales bacterium]